MDYMKHRVSYGVQSSMIEYFLKNRKEDKTTISKLLSGQEDSKLKKEINQ